MASVSSISIIIKAVTSPFIKGIKRALGAVKRFTGALTSVMKNIVKYGLLLTAVAVGALIFFMKKQAKALDELAKFSSILGVAADQLRGFKQAATEAGVADTVFNKSLLNMTRMVADAADGLGLGQDALEKLGLEAKALVKLTPDKMLLKIGKAMKNLPQNTKIQVASNLFGARGISILKLLEMTEDQILDIVKSSKELGGMLSKQDLNNIQEMNDNLARFGKVWDGIINQVLFLFAPAIQAANDKAVELFTTFRKFLEENREAIRTKFVNALEKVVTVLVAIGKTAVLVIGGLVKVLSIDTPKGINAALAAFQGLLGGVSFVFQNIQEAWGLTMDSMIFAVQKVTTEIAALFMTPIILIARNLIASAKFAFNVVIASAKDMAEEIGLRLKKAFTFDKKKLAEIKKAIVLFEGRKAKKTVELFSGEGFSTLKEAHEEAKDFVKTMGGSDIQKDVVKLENRWAKFFVRMNKFKKDFIKGNLVDVEDFMKPIRDALGPDMGKAFADGFKDGMAGIIPDLKNAAEELKAVLTPQGTLAKLGSQAAAKGELGIINQQKMMVKIGRDQLNVQREIRDNGKNNAIPEAKIF